MRMRKPCHARGGGPGGAGPPVWRAAVCAAADLYIPPDALEVFLEAFEGPLDLLLYLIRKQNFNILDIPMAGVTRQYLATWTRSAAATWSWPPNTC
jgi:hypothetical protein